MHDEWVVQQQNQMINDWLKQNQGEIENGSIRVFALDECHVCAGDICGYGWGDRQERREVEVDNYRNSQTYYGAAYCHSGEVILSAYQTANTPSNN